MFDDVQRRVRGDPACLVLVFVHVSMTDHRSRRTRSTVRSTIRRHTMGRPCVCDKRGTSFVVQSVVRSHRVWRQAKGMVSFRVSERVSPRVEAFPVRS